MFNIIKFNKTKILLFRSIITSNYKKNKKIIHIIDPTAGLANSLRGTASTILLSYLYDSCFLLEGWKSIIYYFNFPNHLIAIKNYSVNFSFSRFNKSILKILLTKNVIISIKDIHGFIDILLYNRNTYKRISILKKIYSIGVINKRIFKHIIYDEFFIPTKEILFYLDTFLINRKKKKVLGIHIRSGIFSNNFTEDYFYKIHLNKFYAAAEKVINKYNFSYVFAISDNENYLNKVKKHFRYNILNISFKGDIIHARFSLYQPYNNYNAVRIVSEFILLSSCDYIIGTKRSSFSIEACDRLMNRCILI